MGDLASSAQLGFESGQKIGTGQNPMGDFIRNMLQIHQQNQQAVTTAATQMISSQADARNKAYGDIIKGSQPTTMQYSDPSTGKVSTYTSSSGYAPDTVSGAYKGLGIPQPASTQPISNIIPGQTPSTDTQDNALPKGASVVKSGGKTTFKPPTQGYGKAMIDFAKETGSSIYEAVKKGDMSEYMNADGKTRDYVGKLAADDGLDLDNRFMGYNAKKTAMGGVKIAQAKVDAANQAQQLIEQAYDPATGEYHIAPSNHQELAIAVARLLSPSGQISEAMVNQLKAQTGREALSTVGIYFGMDPEVIGGPTQGVVNLFIDTINREAVRAQKTRDSYLQGQAPSFESNIPSKSPVPGMGNSQSNQTGKLGKYSYSISGKQNG